MSKLTSLALTCEFADFAQAYFEQMKNCSKVEQRTLTADELNKYLGEMAEIYVTGEQLLGCDEITVYVATGQEFVCDCKDARQLLLDIIRIAG